MYISMMVFITFLTYEISHLESLNNRYGIRRGKIYASLYGMQLPDKTYLYLALFHLQYN